MAEKRGYDLSLLDAMRAGEYMTEYEGVEILVKPIPEGGEPGDMDPRQYEGVKDMPAFVASMPPIPEGASLLERIAPWREMFAPFFGRRIVEEGIVTEHITVSGSDGYEVPVRVYRRENAGKDLPLFVYYHGGGLFGGSAQVTEQTCMLLVEKYDCVAFNVDYRLSPENAYPKPLDDCFCATKWAYEHAEQYGADRNKLVVSGDSAGGYLAAAVTQRDLAEGSGMVKAQVLIYPVLNIAGKETRYYHGVDESRFTVNQKFTSAFQGMYEAMKLMGGRDLLKDVYLQGREEPTHPYVSPALGDLDRLPPTLLMFGEFDALVMFDAFAYAQSLTEIHKPLKTIVYRGMGHGFIDQVGNRPQAEDGLEEIAAFMRKVLDS